MIWTYIRCVSGCSICLCNVVAIEPTFMYGMVEIQFLAMHSIPYNLRISIHMGDTTIYEYSYYRYDPYPHMMWREGRERGREEGGGRERKGEKEEKKAIYKL